MENNTENLKNDFVLTLFEACEILNKSSRTVSRYVRKGVLHPMGIKSRQGTLEYRFSRTEIDALKKEEDELRQITYLPQGTPVMPSTAKFASVSFQEPAPVIQMPQISQADETPATDQIRELDGKEKKLADEPEELPESRQDSVPLPSADKEIITLLKETTEILRDQLQVKDEQIQSLNSKIDNLIERDRETNILLKGMQDKMMQLEQPKRREDVKTEVERTGETIASKPIKDVSAEMKSAAKDNVQDNKKDTQDSREKAEKDKSANSQKKTKPVKQKKGFWSGLFG